MLIRHLATLAATLSLAAASAAQVKAVRPPSIPHRLASPAVAAIQAIKPENIETGFDPWSDYLQQKGK